MFVGLDVHRKVCYGTVLDDRGRVVKQGRFSNDPDSLDGFLEGLGESRIVMESGYCWQPLYDRLEEKGCDVRMAHPLKTKVIAEAKVKTDKVDSEMLAHLLRADLLPESWVPPREIRALRDLVKRRAFLVRIRTQLKNRVHAELAKRDIALDVSPFTRDGTAVLRSLGLEAVDQLLPVIETLDRQIGVISRQLKRIVREDEEAGLLTTIPGVGYYIALLLVAEIGDVERFPSPEKLCSYAGLVPSVRRSGNSTIHGSITKEGSKWIRWALTQAVHAHLRFDTQLTRFHNRLAEKKPKPVAITATARKLLTVVYWMLKRREPFHPGKITPTTKLAA